MQQDEMTIRDALEVAVTTEQLAADYYNSLAGRFPDERDVVDVFRQLARDEQGHEATFKALLESATGESEPERNKQKWDYLTAVSRSQFFDREYFRDMAEVKDVSEALGHALAFERATLLYYEGIRDAIGSVPQLDRIIDAEKSHVVNLTRIIPTDAKFRGLDDTF